MSKSGLMKSSGVIGLATATSRILGFIRDVVIANFFGTSIGAQAFVVAFRIPNSLRDLVGEGATNAAIVPVLTEYKTLKGEKEFQHISRVLFNICAAALLALTAIGIIFSPLIVRIIAPGFIENPEKLQLTIRLNRIIFPYLILIGLTAYSMGVLNALKHFASPAFGPCLLNLAMIGSALWLCPKIGVAGLAAGVLIGGAMQLILSVPFLYKHGITIRLKDGFRHPAVRRIGKLMVPRALGSAIYQINIFVNTMLASLGWIVGQGGVAALYYANRLIQFPLAIFGFAIAQAALPKMSEEYASKDIDKLKDTLAFSLRVVFFVMIPSAFGLAILGEPIVRMLFQRGEFTEYSTMITRDALFFYSFGLFAYSGTKLLVSAFYSMHDTRTPVKISLASAALNIVLNIILMWPLKLGGLALATSISAIFNFLALYILLKKRMGDFGTRQISDSFFRIFCASLVMSAVMAVMLKYIKHFDFVSLLLCIITAIMTFLLTCVILKVKEIKDFAGWIARIR